jgi:hypothetical protein
MAQVTGGSNFDSVWEGGQMCRSDSYEKPRTDSQNPVREHLRRRRWPRVSSASPRPTSPYNSPKWPVRFFDGTQEPPTVADSLAQLATSSVSEDPAEIEDALTGVIAAAAADWAQGDPENPKTRGVLTQLLQILWIRRLIPYPPSHEYPRGV